MGLSGKKCLVNFPDRKQIDIMKINADNIIRLQFVPYLLKTVPAKKKKSLML